MTHVLSGKALLLVDDRPENLLTLQALLEPTGVHTLTAHSGNEALKLLYRDAQVHGVLMDVQMPDMGGFEAAALLQQLPQTASIPIVFITADDAQREVDEPYKAQLPQPYFLYKPIDRERLVQVLQEVLEK